MKTLNISMLIAFAVGFNNMLQAGSSHGFICVI